MRKSTLFISAVLTTFMLAVLVGAVSAYKGTLTSTSAAAATQDPPTAIALVDTPIPTAASLLTPEQAAALAAQVMGRSDLYSVETTLFNNADAYLVTFSSGDLVYVSPEGQILSISHIPTTVAASAPVVTSNNNQPKRPRSSSSTGGGGSGEYEGGGEGGDD